MTTGASLSQTRSYSIPSQDGEPVAARVKWFDAPRGFGFVTPADGSGDAFLHISALNRAGLHVIAAGTDILCRIAAGRQGRQVVQLVEVLGVAPPDAPPPGPEITGTVAWFTAEKGFGFVLADDGDGDVFVHRTTLRRCALVELATGQRVALRVRATGRGREATWIALR